MQVATGSKILDTLTEAFGSARMHSGFILVREDVNDTIGWVVAGCHSSESGWMLRCVRGDVLAVECAAAEVTSITDEIESSLVRPTYDEESATLDGYAFFVMVLRNGLRARFTATTTRMDLRLLRVSDALFDSPRIELRASDAQV